MPNGPMHAIPNLAPPPPSSMISHSQRASGHNGGNGGAVRRGAPDGGVCRSGPCRNISRPMLATGCTLSWVLLRSTEPFGVATPRNLTQACEYEGRLWKHPPSREQALVKTISPKWRCARWQTARVAGWSNHTGDAPQHRRWLATCKLRLAMAAPRSSKKHTPIEIGCKAHIWQVPPGSACHSGMQQVAYMLVPNNQTR